MEKSVKYLANRPEGVQYYLEFEVFDIFFQFSCSKNVGKVHIVSQIDIFFSKYTKVTTK